MIGKGGGLPWRIPADLKRFKALTMGGVLVMGRKTWDEVGRPLPGRRTIVVTRNRAFRAAGAEVAPSLEAALATAAGWDVPEVFVVGGGEIYAQALPIADVLDLTAIEADVEGDTRFPAFDESAWRLVSEERLEAGDGSPFALAFRRYERAARG